MSMPIQLDFDDTIEAVPKPIVLRAPDLPATVSDLKRKSLRSRTINDFVEDVFLVLYDTSERFKSYLDAVSNEDAIEGLKIADDLQASEMIRESAPEGSPLKKKNLATIRRALGVVLRRYGISRTERAQLLGGEIVRGTDEA